LKIKEKHSISEAAFNDIIRTCKLSGITLYKLRKALANLVPIEPALMDCCVRSCMAFTGDYACLDHCSICNERRYTSAETIPGKPRKQAVYWSPISLLRMQYQSQERARSLLYRYQYTTSLEYAAGTHIQDVFDGTRYKELLNSGYFQDPRDVALIASMDGYQVFQQKRDDCWIVMLINGNLPPSERVKKENLIIAAMFPGPQQPKNINSFLQPLVEDLKKLEGEW